VGKDCIPPERVSQLPYKKITAEVLSVKMGKMLIQQGGREGKSRERLRRKDRRASTDIVTNEGGREE